MFLKAITNNEQCFSRIPNVFSHFKMIIILTLMQNRCANFIAVAVVKGQAFNITIDSITTCCW